MDALFTTCILPHIQIGPPARRPHSLLPPCQTTDKGHKAALCVCNSLMRPMRRSSPQAPAASSRAAALDSMRLF